MEINNVTSIDVDIIENILTVKAAAGHISLHLPDIHAVPHYSGEEEKLSKITFTSMGDVEFECELELKDVLMLVVPNKRFAPLIVPGGTERAGVLTAKWFNQTTTGFSLTLYLRPELLKQLLQALTGWQLYRKSWEKNDIQT